MSHGPIRISVIDDLPDIREWLTAVLRHTPGFTLLGIHPNADEALSAFRVSRPDCVLVDLAMPGKPGSAVIRELRSKYDRVTIIAFTVHSEPELVFTALKAGADGYVLKLTPPAELLVAIREAVAGGSPMTPSIARLVFRYFRRLPQPAADAECLTLREEQVLELLAEGLSRKEVAARLNLSADTVHSHQSSIYRKLHVNGAREAISKWNQLRQR